MLFRQRLTLDWEEIKNIRLKQAKANNKKENKKRRDHKYKVGDLVLIVMKDYKRKKAPKISSPTNGPHKIVKIYPNNGNVRIQNGNFEEVISIRRLKPYKAR